MKSQYQLVVADENSKHAWNNYLKGKRISPGFNAYEWRHILSDTYQPDQCHFFVCDDSNQIRGVLPTYIITDVKKKRHLFSSRQGMVADNQEVALLLADAARQFAEEQGVIKAEISTAGKPFDLGCPCSEKYTIRLDLTKKKEEFWKNMRDKTRNAIRKGEKYHLTIQQNYGLLNKFYQIYSSRMARKFITFHSYAFFESIVNHFGNQCEIYIALYQNKPVGSMLIIYFGSTAVYAYGGMLPGYEKYCPNQIG